MAKAIYPGSFDPITNGHIDIIERASKMFDKLIVGVLINNTKDPLFTPAERVDMIKSVVGHFVKCGSFRICRIIGGFCTLSKIVIYWLEDLE